MRLLCEICKINEAVKEVQQHGYSTMICNNEVCSNAPGILNMPPLFSRFKEAVKCSACHQEMPRKVGFGLIRPWPGAIASLDKDFCVGCAERLHDIFIKMLQEENKQ